MNSNTVTFRLLQLTIDKVVSEKLGGIAREFGDYLKDLSVEERQEAARLVLKMMERATNEFLTKMEGRIELLKAESK